MTKDEYKKAIEILDARINKTIEQKKIIQDVYIKAHAPYPIGTKIKIFLPEHFKVGTRKILPPREIEAYIGGYRNFDGDLTPQLYHVKKDGTQSTARLYLKDYPIAYEKDRHLKWTIIK